MPDTPELFSILHDTINRLTDRLNDVSDNLAIHAKDLGSCQAQVKLIWAVVILMLGGVLTLAGNLVVPLLVGK